MSEDKMCVRVEFFHTVRTFTQPIVSISADVSWMEELEYVRCDRHFPIIEMRENFWLRRFASRNQTLSKRITSLTQEPKPQRGQGTVIQSANQGINRKC